MKSPHASEDLVVAAERALEQKRRTRDRLLRQKFSAQLMPGLPIDADAPQLRARAPRLTAVFDEVIHSLTEVKNPFFEVVCKQFRELFPTLPAQPGRYQNGQLFLYVTKAPTLFLLRPKLPQIKKMLQKVPHAPKRFSVKLEIHAPPKREKCLFA